MIRNNVREENSRNNKGEHVPCPPSHIPSQPAQKKHTTDQTFPCPPPLATLRSRSAPAETSDPTGKNP
jgi:hypothetical protein